MLSLIVRTFSLLVLSIILGAYCRPLLQVLFFYVVAAAAVYCGVAVVVVSLQCHCNCFVCCGRVVHGIACSCC